MYSKWSALIKSCRISDSSVMSVLAYTIVHPICTGGSLIVSHGVTVLLEHLTDCSITVSPGVCVCVCVCVCGVCVCVCVWEGPREGEHMPVSSPPPPPSCITD